jgi:hypothetical protein
MPSSGLDTRGSKISMADAAEDEGAGHGGGVGVGGRALEEGDGDGMADGVPAVAPVELDFGLAEDSGGGGLGGADAIVVVAAGQADRHFFECEAVAGRQKSDRQGVRVHRLLPPFAR